jgi:hypothetical protein
LINIGGAWRSFVIGNVTMTCRYFDISSWPSHEALDRYVGDFGS